MPHTGNLLITGVRPERAAPICAVSPICESAIAAYPACENAVPCVPSGGMSGRHFYMGPSEQPQAHAPLLLYQPSFPLCLWLYSALFRRSQDRLLCRGATKKIDCLKLDHFQSVIGGNPTHPHLAPQQNSSRFLVRPSVLSGRRPSAVSHSSRRNDMVVIIPVVSSYSTWRFYHHARTARSRSRLG